jgi:enoyl-[acyl-carrier-protein] reductase (NADH)
VKGPRLDRVIAGVMKHSGKTLEDVTEKFTDGTALKTLVDPKYIGAVVAFLCSEDAAMMTGQDINVSAGATMY